MNILYLTKSKPYTLKFLEKMVESGNMISVVCKDFDSFRNTNMERYCLDNDIEYYDNCGLYKALDNNDLRVFDIAISNNFGKLIKKELIERMKGNIINLHGAILPKYKGAFTYNWGIFNGESEWGVTAHYVNSKFDEGDIITISRFPIDPSSISISELESLTQKTAYELSLEIIRQYSDGKLLCGTPQEDAGCYYSRSDFETLKKIELSDSEEIIERKIHSCWCPPYEGAYIAVCGKRYYLLDDDMMECIKNIK